MGGRWEEVVIVNLAVRNQISFYALPYVAQLNQTKPNQTAPGCTEKLDNGHGCNAMFILLIVPLITKNGAKSTCCIVRVKFLVSLCSKTAIFLEPCRNIYFSCRNITMLPALTPTFPCRDLFKVVCKNIHF